MKTVFWIKSDSQNHAKEIQEALFKKDLCWEGDNGLKIKNVLHTTMPSFQVWDDGYITYGYENNQGDGQEITIKDIPNICKETWTIKKKKREYNYWIQCTKPQANHIIRELELTAQDEEKFDGWIVIYYNNEFRFPINQPYSTTVNYEKFCEMCNIPQIKENQVDKKPDIALPKEAKAQITEATGKSCSVERYQVLPQKTEEKKMSLIAYLGLKHWRPVALIATVVGITLFVKNYNPVPKFGNEIKVTSIERTIGEPGNPSKKIFVINEEDKYIWIKNQGWYGFKEQDILTCESDSRYELLEKAWEIHEMDPNFETIKPPKGWEPSIYWCKWED